MEPAQRSDSKDGSLNDSWVELNFQQQQNSAIRSQHEATGPALTKISNGAMEKLLLEAQRESSRSSSRTPSNFTSNASSRGSPKSPHSPNNELAGAIPPIQEGQVVSAIQAADWIWDWSSRPEAHPPSDWGSKFKHPQKPKLSMRNTSVMRSALFSLENLPTLLFTHACSFLIGAAMMFMYMKKYSNWTAVTPIQSLSLD